MRGLIFPTTLPLLFIGGLFLARAAPTIQQQYLDLYVQMHDAENLEKKGDLSGALKDFEAIYNGLSAIHQSDANWEPALVGHRMDDCKVTIEKLKAEVAKTSPTPGTATTVDPAPPTADVPDPALKTDSSSSQIKNNYPWKTNIVTELFYIGGKSKMNNAWKLTVPKGASVNDDPDDRNGYASGSHASFFNPFYVALPFNDLAHPDKAKQYLPAGWQQPDRDGKPVSACQHRWVEIKTEDGTNRTCYAQWEDVGPLRNDHAEYVFGNERPDSGDRAGLDVSPGVAQYLGLAPDRPTQTRWRFVDPEKVPPGQWLKYDEQAVIYTAMHQTPDSVSLPSPTPPPGITPVNVNR